jgi:predicted transcriptional regulator
MVADEKLLWAALDGDEAFRRTLAGVLEGELDMTAREFARRSGLGESTVYKMLSGARRPNLATLRRVVRAVQEVEGTRRGRFVALIASRAVVEDVRGRANELELGGVKVREYPAFNMEEAIIQSIRAEREGAVALVCAPIVSSTLEKILHIPVATIQPKRCVLDAIELAAKKGVWGS